MTLVFSFDDTQNKKFVSRKSMGLRKKKKAKMLSGVKKGRRLDASHCQSMTKTNNPSSQNSRDQCLAASSPNLKYGSTTVWIGGGPNQGCWYNDCSECNDPHGNPSATDISWYGNNYCDRGTVFGFDNNDNYIGGTCVQKFDLGYGATFPDDCNALSYYPLNGECWQDVDNSMSSADTDTISGCIEDSERTWIKGTGWCLTYENSDYTTAAACHEQYNVFYTGRLTALNNKCWESESDESYDYQYCTGMGGTYVFTEITDSSDGSCANQPNSECAGQMDSYCSANSDMESCLEDTSNYNSVSYRRDCCAWEVGGGGGGGGGGSCSDESVSITWDDQDGDASSTSENSITIDGNTYQQDDGDRTICLSAGSYTMTGTDSYGDGWDNGGGDTSSVTLTHDGITVVDRWTGPQDTSTDTKNFEIASTGGGGGGGGGGCYQDTGMFAGDQSGCEANSNVYINDVCYEDMGSTVTSTGDENNEANCQLQGFTWIAGGGGGGNQVCAFEEGEDEYSTGANCPTLTGDDCINYGCRWVSSGGGGTCSGQATVVGTWTIVAQENGYRGYEAENSVIIDGTEYDQVDGDFTVCLDYGSHTIKGTDDYNDGWNYDDIEHSTITLTADGIVVLNHWDMDKDQATYAGSDPTGKGQQDITFTIEHPRTCGSHKCSHKNSVSCFSNTDCYGECKDDEADNTGSDDNKVKNNDECEYKDGLLDGLDWDNDSDLQTPNFSSQAKIDKFDMGDISGLDTESKRKKARRKMIRQMFNRNSNAAIKKFVMKASKMKLDGFKRPPTGDNLIQVVRGELKASDNTDYSDLTEVETDSFGTTNPVYVPLEKNEAVKVKVTLDGSAKVVIMHQISDTQMKVKVNSGTIVTLTDGGSSHIESGLDISFVGSGGIETDIVPGCTDDGYLEYNAQANQDDGSCTTVKVDGCTDDGYIEYNAAANFDDGSCATVIVNGCTNSAAFNYNAAANVDDGSCTAVASGCTDDGYLEYDAAANTDDGSCATVKVDGCTNILYLEYSAAANADDGSCVTLKVSGCMNTVTACNYDANNNFDDGTCYSEDTAVYKYCLNSNAVSQASVLGCSGSHVNGDGTYSPCSNVDILNANVGGCMDSDANNYDANAIIPMTCSYNCDCANGAGSSDCTATGQSKCYSCNSGFVLDTLACVSQCVNGQANNNGGPAPCTFDYICPNGQPVTPGTGASNGIIKCNTCNVGYATEAYTIINDEVSQPQFTITTEAECQAAAIAMGNAQRGVPYSFEAKTNYPVSGCTIDNPVSNPTKLVWYDAVAANDVTSFACGWGNKNTACVEKGPFCSSTCPDPKANNHNQIGDCTYDSCADVPPTALCLAGDQTASDDSVCNSGTLCVLGCTEVGNEAYYADATTDDGTCVPVTDFYLEADPESAPLEQSVWDTKDVACGNQFVSIEMVAGVPELTCRSCTPSNFKLEFGKRQMIAPQRHGKCCVNSHHHVCQQLMNSYKNTCTDDNGKKAHYQGRTC